MENRSFHEVVVIGAGVSGMTCAMYLARANVDVCLIGDYTTTPLLSTPSIQNYPGIGNISGMEFLENLHKQVLESGACIVEANAMAPMIKDDGWIILTDNGDIIDTKNIVVATGSSARMLNLENEEEFIGKGVSTCAYCDGSLYEGKDVCVVGSGTLAIEEAMYLAKICRRVTVLCRKSEFSTSVYTPDQLNKYDNIAVLFDANVAKIVGSGEKIMVILAGTRSRIVSFDGIFYAIGSSPNTSFLEKLYPLDNNGYIDLPDEVSTKHHMYACGDVNASNRFKQVVTAASDGCNTALKILKISETNKEINMKLVLYTTHCPKCKVIESKLNAKKIEFDIVDDKSTLIEMGIVSVPVLEADGKKMSFLEANKYVNSL